MAEEIFGPVLTIYHVTFLSFFYAYISLLSLIINIYVYPDAKYEETLHLCDETSPYSLTGSIFATEREAIILATNVLRNSSGNFCILL